MPPLPNLKIKELLRILRLAGFFIKRQTGSHIILKHPNGRRTVVPFHQGKDLPTGTLRAILNDVDISVAELIRLLNQ